MFTNWIAVFHYCHCIKTFTTIARMTRIIAAAAGVTIAAGIAVLAWCVIPAWAGQSDSKALPLSIIVVSSEPEAQKLLGLLHNGGDFAKLAKDVSIDPTVVDGGYLGEMNPANLRPELQAALKDLRPGQVSAIIRLQSA